MKVDLKREIPTYAARRGRFDLVEVPPMQYLMLDGRGDPNTATDYRDAVASLYPLAYRLKFLSKHERERDYVVPPLEALWWADDMASFTSRRDKARWHWTLMILVPDWLTGHDVDEARTGLAAPQLDAVRLDALDEGWCVQTLHVGPYDDEGPVLQHLHDREITARGLRMVGCHHEVYLSDSRRTEPSRLRTILRQPVVRQPDA